MDLDIRLDQLTNGDLLLFAALGAGYSGPGALWALLATLDRLVEGGVTQRHPRDLPFIVGQVIEAVAAHLATSPLIDTGPEQAPLTRPYTAAVPEHFN